MNSEKILKYAIYAGLFLVPLVPLYVAGSFFLPKPHMFFPFITGKAFFFRIIVEIIFGAWLILALKNPIYRPKRSWLLYAFTAFVFLITLSDIFSGHFLKSFWSNFERMEGLVTLLHLLAYFYVLTSFIKSEKIWQRLIKTSVAISLIIGSWGFFQLFGKYTSIQSGNRLDGSFGNASYLAIYMFFHLFLTCYLLTKHQGEKWVRWLYGVFIAFQAFILIFTQTRGTILALFGSVFLTFLMIAIFEKTEIKLKKWAIGILVGLLALAGTFFLIKDSKLIENIDPLRRLASISLTERTTASRFLIWNMAWQGFKERPLLGWGQENFIFVFEKYYDPGMYAQEPWFDRAHNIFFDWLIAGGALGLLAYLSLFAVSLYLLWRSSEFSVSQKALLASLLVGYFFHNFFVFDNIASYIMFVLVLAFINFKSQATDEQFEFSKNPPLNNLPLSYQNVLAPIILTLTIFSLYFFNAKPILASTNLIQALSPQTEGLSKNLELFQKVLAYDTVGRTEAREQLLTSTTAVANTDAPPELKEAFITLAISEQQKEIDRNPQSARAYVFMGSLLSSLRHYDEALSYFEEALKISPKKQDISFGFVRAYLNKGDYQKAVNFAEQAFLLDERFDTARIIYAVALIYNREADKAENILAEKFNENFADERLAGAYFSVKDYSRAVREWQRLILREPNNTQFRVSLAATLLESGDRLGAVKVLEETAVVDPNFKDQANFFIREIQAGRNP